MLCCYVDLLTLARDAYIDSPLDVLNECPSHVRSASFARQPEIWSKAATIIQLGSKSIRINAKHAQSELQVSRLNAELPRLDVLSWLVNGSSGVRAITHESCRTRTCTVHARVRPNCQAALKVVPRHSLLNDLLIAILRSKEREVAHASGV